MYRSNIRFKLPIDILRKWINGSRSLQKKEWNWRFTLSFTTFFLFLLCEIKCTTYLLPWLVHWPSSWPDRTDATAEELSIQLELDKGKHWNCFFRKESMWIRRLCDSVTEQAKLFDKSKVVSSNANGLLIWRLVLLQHILFDSSYYALVEVGKLT
jgi:hypothetical protein